MTAALIGGMWARAVVQVARECDPGRKRFPAKLLNISIAGISLVTAVRIEPNEQVRVDLQHDITRAAAGHRIDGL